MKKSTGKLSVKLLFFSAAALALLSAFAFVLGRQDPVKANEVGVVMIRSGEFTVSNPGTTPFAIPLLQKYYRISTETVTLSFVDNEGVRVKKGSEGEAIVESQVMYSIADIVKVLRAFGPADTHLKIRNKIRIELERLITQNIPDAELLNDSGQRVVLTAQIHIDLSSLLQEQGISVSGYQIRYR